MRRTFLIILAVTLLAFSSPARWSIANEGNGNGNENGNNGNGNGNGNNGNGNGNNGNGNGNNGNGNGNGNGQSHSPDKTNGGYKLTIAGYLTGDGTATISGQHLTIAGHVKDSTGRAIDFQVQCDADKNRFKGSGDAGGQQIDLEGRFDPPDKTGKVVRGARLVATYETADGHHGRIAGERSADANRPPDREQDRD